MRVHILSDLHLEFAPFHPNTVEADVVVLAGDVHTGKNGIKWILKSFPDHPVIYILGNHEFYGQKIPRLYSEIKELAKGTNVHVLDNDRVEISDVVFLGTTLWTDFRLNGDAVLAEVTAQTGMIRSHHFFEGIAQSAERVLHMHQVEGAIPFALTISVPVV